MEPYANAGCVLMLNANCHECKAKLMGVLSSIRGVYSVNIDAERGIADICGEVDPNMLLRELARSGEHAELVRVKLQHPALGQRLSAGSNSSAYGVGSTHELLSNDPYDSLGRRRITSQPYYNSYYDDHVGTTTIYSYPRMERHLPEDNIVHDYPSSSWCYNNTTSNYYADPLPRARYVPSRPQGLDYNPLYHDDEPLSFCTIL